MNWLIDFEVPGDPKALKRHRTFKKGNYTGTYDPSAGDKADFLIKALQYKPDIPYDEPLYVVLNFAFSRPKAHFRTGANSNLLKPSAPIWHTKTPDIDNLVKFVCDAFNKVYWRDDSIIACLFVKKSFSLSPGVRIQIATMVNLLNPDEQNKKKKSGELF